MKTNCVTHHYACDCREEIFKETQDKLRLALEIIEKQKDIITFVANIQEAVEITADHYWSLEDHAQAVGLNMEGTLLEKVRAFNSAHDAFCQVEKVKSEVNEMLARLK